VKPLHAGLAIGAAINLPLIALCIACTPAQVAEVKSVDSIATEVTGLACDVAATQPVGQPVGQPWTDFVCDGLQAAEGVVAALPVPDAGPDAASVPPATVLSGTILVHVPAEQVSAFLESHPRRKHKAPSPGLGLPGAPGVTTVTVILPSDAGPG
jgi:hypothetical protein